MRRLHIFLVSTALAELCDTVSLFPALCLHSLPAVTDLAVKRHACNGHSVAKQGGDSDRISEVQQAEDHGHHTLGVAQHLQTDGTE